MIGIQYITVHRKKSHSQHIKLSVSWIQQDNVNIQVTETMDRVRIKIVKSKEQKGKTSGMIHTKHREELYLLHHHPITKYTPHYQNKTSHSHIV